MTAPILPLAATVGRELTAVLATLVSLALGSHAQLVLLTASRQPSTTQGRAHHAPPTPTQEVPVEVMLAQIVCAVMDGLVRMVAAAPKSAALGFVDTIPLFLLTHVWPATVASTRATPALPLLARTAAAVVLA